MDFFYAEFIVALAVFDIALVGRNPYKRGSVKLAAYAPIEASALERVGSLALLCLGVALRAAIAFPYPLGEDGIALFRINTDTHSAEKITLALVMLALPVGRANWSITRKSGKSRGGSIRVTLILYLTFL